jgi:hypothetical protein
MTKLIPIIPPDRRTAIINSAVDLVRELIERNIDEAIRDACEDFQKDDEAPEPVAKLTAKIEFHPLKDVDEIKIALKWPVKRGETATCDVPSKQEKFTFEKPQQPEPAQ